MDLSSEWRDVLHLYSYFSQIRSPGGCNILMWRNNHVEYLPKKGFRDWAFKGHVFESPRQHFNLSANFLHRSALLQNASAPFEGKTSRMVFYSLSQQNYISTVSRTKACICTSTQIVNDEVCEIAVDVDALEFSDTKVFQICYLRLFVDAHHFIRAVKNGSPVHLERVWRWDNG